jgi:hypothetical protein
MALPLLALKWVVDLDFSKLNAAVRAGHRAALKEKAKKVALAARRQIVKATGASRPGQMIRGKTGHYKRSIKYHVYQSTAIVGPTWPKGAHAGMLKYGTKRMEPRLVPSQEGLKEESHSISEWRNRL